MLSGCGRLFNPAMQGVTVLVIRHLWGPGGPGELLQLPGGPADDVRLRAEALGGPADLLLRFLPLLLLDRLADPGHRLHAVARVQARGVDPVAVPGAPGQAVGAGDRKSTRLNSSHTV